ncbi:hypothetical protein QQY66_43530 [Streptomyces sp. DG2A-72]|uniref:hypothetical protein n=1 Tax=Streptomyces sp. DG2A-72 TaxID=3051386 RepID=UPI00265B97F3|nr:hypothetical protein [Streptomyces sp. DG2A-72]MDO0938270.1 hypothetical protein [Streptomyces sp. DG2A-72]
MSAADIDPEALRRGLEVLIDIETYARDRKMFEEFESTVAVADHADQAAYEAFVTDKLGDLPAVLRLESHLTMKKIKADG